MVVFIPRPRVAAAEQRRADALLARIAVIAEHPGHPNHPSLPMFRESLRDALANAARHAVQPSRRGWR